MSKINDLLLKLTNFTQSGNKLVCVDNSGSTTDKYIDISEMYDIARTLEENKDIALAGYTLSFSGNGEVTIAPNLIVSGQAHGGSYTKTFSASATFDADDGNNQKMVVTASTTINLSNELPGVYVIKLEIDTAGSPTITIGASIGTKLPNGSLDIDNSDNAINIITIVVDPDGTKDYSIIN